VACSEPVPLQGGDSVRVSWDMWSVRAAILFVVLVGALGAAPDAHSARVGSFLYYRFDPPVIYSDGRTPTTLEVATTGWGIAEVLVELPELGFRPMYDDGTHGDRVAGDGIYTLEGITVSLPIRSFGGTHAVSGFEVKIIKSDGTEEVNREPSLGLVDADQWFPAVQLGQGPFRGEAVYATAYALFIVDPFGSALGTPNWPLGSVRCGRRTFAAFHKLYSFFPDLFDFVIVMPSGGIFDPKRDYAENVPYFVAAKNEVRHIGIPLFDKTAAFGSRGRLRGMIYHSFGVGSILDHEIGHAWSALFGRKLGLTDWDGRTRYDYRTTRHHWNPYTDIAGQMAAFVSHPDVQYGAGHLMDNGDGTWRIEREPADDTPYSKLDLYLMGLIPPEEVPPIHLLVDPDLSHPQRVTAEQVKTYTIEQLMGAEGGERIPSWRDSQKEFNIAFIIVKDRPFTPAEFAFFSLVARYFASRERGDLSLTTFYAATGGRATLNARLPIEIPDQ